MVIKELLKIWPGGDDTGETIVLDVGAQLGIHGLFAAKLGHRVWAVEPQEVNLAKVKNY